MSIISKALTTLLHGIFPSVCLLCNEELPRNQKSICVFCEKELPIDYLATHERDNKIVELFYGRILIENAFCQFSFEKDSKVQLLLHQIKYKDQSNFARLMGEKIGENLLKTKWYDDIDVLLPVPIHPRKKFERGYNQSECLAEGIAKKTNKAIDNEVLQRRLHQESQTKQGRFNRWTNLQNTFDTRQTIEKYRHVAIVDDVVTTGATIEKIAVDLRLKNPKIRISIITLAVAK